MNEQGHDMIALLSVVDWFSSIGQPVSTPVKQCMSWQEADRSCAHDRWKKALLESSNDITIGLYRNFPEAKHPRNAVVLLIKEIMAPIVTSKTHVLVEEGMISEQILSTINWSMLHIVLASHFGEKYLSPFYTELACWYVKGHFPCGWEGEYPQGQLIVY